MAADVTELLQSIGGGTGGGALLGGLLAKYFMGKTDKEIEQIKLELQNNKDADALRDTAIELLKKDAENNNKSNEELKAFFIKLDEKLDKKFDQIMERLNNA